MCDFDLGELEVIITRQNSGISKASPIKISKISEIHWSNESGGYHTKTNNYMLFGYIPYDIAAKLVDCSGTHKYYNNDAKICIPKSFNTEEPYKSAYQQLEKAYIHQKPISLIRQNRPQGYPPCTKQILKLLKEESPQLRGELRDTILAIGYTPVNFRNAMKTLVNDGRIKTTGSSASPKQIITLP